MVTCQIPKVQEFIARRIAAIASAKNE